MKKYLFGFLMFFALSVDAQYHEVSLGVGIANYYGDLSLINTSTSVIEPITSFSFRDIKMGYTGEYRYHFKKHFSVALCLSHLYVSAYDSDNESNQEYDRAFYRKIRNLSFHSTINEANINVRYEPFRNEEKWNQNKFHLSPYIGLGVGIFKFNPKAFYNGNEYELQPLGTEGQGLPGAKAKYSLTQFSLPMILGFKVTAPNRKVSMAIDVAYRWTTTDYLDDVSTVYADPAVFTANYSASEAALISALAERRQEIDPAGNYAAVTNKGEIRGWANNTDAFLTAQVRFSFLLPSFKGESTDCYRISR